MKQAFYLRMSREKRVLCSTFLGMRFRLVLACCLATISFPLLAQTNSPEPIIDMHLHALPARSQGPPPVSSLASQCHLQNGTERWNRELQSGGGVIHSGVQAVSY